MTKEKVFEVAPDISLLQQLKGVAGDDLSTCYQCQKCSSGCPIAFAMDYLPHVILHMLHLGLEDEVLRSSTIWLCASCETCTTRCPNDIDIARIMDRLRERAVRAGVTPGEKRALAFHRSFLAAIKGRGRVNELGMIIGYKMRSRDLFSDLRLGLDMLRRGKIKLPTPKIRGSGEVKRLFDESKKKEKS